MANLFEQMAQGNGLYNPTLSQKIIASAVENAEQKPDKEVGVIEGPMTNVKKNTTLPGDNGAVSIHKGLPIPKRFEFIIHNTGTTAQTAQLFDVANLHASGCNTCFTDGSTSLTGGSNSLLIYSGTPACDKKNNIAELIRTNPYQLNAITLQDLSASATRAPQLGFVIQGLFTNGIDLTQQEVFDLSLQIDTKQFNPNILDAKIDQKSQFSRLDKQALWRFTVEAGQKLRLVLHIGHAFQY